MPLNGSQSTTTAKIASSEILKCTLTRKEVAYMWGRTVNTVLFNILRHNLIARQTMGGGWLISYHSVKQLWGEPVRQLPEENTFTGV